MYIEEFHHHFSDEYTKEIKRFTRRAILASGMDCLVVQDRENKRKAYCTHCGKVVEIPENNRHTGSPQYLRKMHYRGYGDVACDPGKIQTCPLCMNKYNVYHEWRMDLSALDGTVSISIWAKSKIDKTAITMRRIEVDRRYFNGKVDNYRYREVERYLFRPGEKALRMKNETNFYTWAKWENVDTNWKFVKVIKDRAANCYSPINPDPLKGSYFMDMNSFKRAIKDTEYQYCEYKELDLSNFFAQKGFKERYPDLLVQYIDLFSRSQWVEVLIKNGMGRIIEEKLRNKAYPRILNWRAKRLARAVFKYTKKDLNDIKKHGGEVGSGELYILLEMRKKLFPDIDFEEIVKYTENNRIYSVLLKIRNFKDTVNAKYIKFKNYCAKQNKLTKQQRSYGEYLIDWMDYLVDAKKLNINIQDPENLWPKNLAKMHVNIINQLQLNEDKKINDKIKKSLEWRKELFSFESKKYLIRPAESVQELIAEGRVLHHCVGGYTNSYAAERTNILFLRRKEYPDIPFATIEVVKGSDKHYLLVQIRASMNSDPPEDARKVAEQLMLKINEKTEGRKERVRIA